MVTWRAVGAGIVELVETPTKLDRRPRRMGTLGMADPNRMFYGPSWSDLINRDTFTLKVPRWLYDYFSLGVFIIH